MHGKHHTVPKGSYTVETMFIHQPGTEDIRTTVWRDRKERVTSTTQTTWTKHWKPSR